MALVTTDKNSTGMDIVSTKSIDDKHTPGVFEVPLLQPLLESYNVDTYDNDTQCFWCVGLSILYLFTADGLGFK